MTDAGAAPPVLVAAGVLVEAGRVLVTRRPAGKHLEGVWELPGGKVEPGEDPREALVRELREELGVEVEAGEILDVTFHRYEGRSLLLLFFEARRTPSSPEPRALEVAELRWVDPRALRAEEFPPADHGIVEKLRRR